MVNKEQVSNSIEKQISTSEIINNKLAIIARLKRLEQDKSASTLIQMLETEVAELQAPKQAATVINMPGEEPFSLYSDSFTEEEEIIWGDAASWEKRKFDNVIDKLSVLFYKTEDKGMRSEFYEKTALLKEMFGDEPHTRDKFKTYINNLLTR